MDVVTAGPHLGEAHGVEAPFIARPGRRGAETDGPHDLALEHPLVHTVLQAHELRALIAVLLRHVLLEQVGGFDDVVIDTHQDHVVDVHGCFPSMTDPPQ